MDFNRTPYAAFGNILIKNTMAAGNTYQWDTAHRYAKCTTFLVSGRATAVNNITGETLGEYLPGNYLREYEYPSGSFTMTVNEDEEVWCYFPDVNKNIITSPFDAMEIAKDISTTLSIGTKMFLCKGTLIIDGKQITGPAQISVKTSDQTALADEHCYALVLK